MEENSEAMSTKSAQTRATPFCKIQAPPREKMKTFLPTLLIKGEEGEGGGGGWRFTHLTLFLSLYPSLTFGVPHQHFLDLTH
jgi:hypothetical protein